MVLGLGVADFTSTPSNITPCRSGTEPRVQHNLSGFFCCTDGYSCVFRDHLCIRVSQKAYSRK